MCPAPRAILQGTPSPREALAVTGWRVAGSAWHWCVGATLGLGLVVGWVSGAGAQTYTFNFGGPTLTVDEHLGIHPVAQETPQINVPYTVTASSDPGTAIVEFTFEVVHGETTARDMVLEGRMWGPNRSAGGRFYAFREVGGVWTNSEDFGMLLVDDHVAEGDETFELRVSSTDSNFMLGTVPTITITIRDNEGMVGIVLEVDGSESRNSLTLVERGGSGCDGHISGGNLRVTLNTEVEVNTTVTPVLDVADVGICLSESITFTVDDKVGVSEGGGITLPSKSVRIAYQNDGFALQDRTVTMSFKIKGERAYADLMLRAVALGLKDNDTAAVNFYGASDTAVEVDSLQTHAVINSIEVLEVVFYVALGTPLPTDETVTVTLTSDAPDKGRFVNMAGAEVAGIELEFTGAIARQAVTLRDVLNDGVTAMYDIAVSVQTTNSASKYKGLNVASLPATNEAILRSPPATIDDLSAAAGNAEVTLSWSAPEGNVFPITRYQYQQTTTQGVYADSPWTDISGGGAVIRYVVSGLTNGTRYYFRVRAVSEVGMGEASNEESATPTLPAVSFGGAMVSTQLYTRSTRIGALQLPAASGGTGSYAYTLTPVPTGLVFDADARTLSGVPVSPAGTEVTLRYTATDTGGTADTDTLTFVVKVFAPPRFSTSVANNVADGQTFRYVPGVAINPPLQLPRGTTDVSLIPGSQGRVIHALTPSTLPEGLSLDLARRTISGSPTAVGGFPFVWTATDINGAAVSRGFTIIIGIALAVSNDADDPEVETEKQVSAVDAAADGLTTWRYTIIDASTTCDAAAFASGAVGYTEGSTVTLEDESDNGRRVCFESTQDSPRATAYASSGTIAGIRDAEVFFYNTNRGSRLDTISTNLLTHAFPSQPNHEVTFYVTPRTLLPDGETVTVTLTSRDREQGVFVNVDGEEVVAIALTFTGAIARQGVTLRGVDNGVFDGATTDYTIAVEAQTTNSESEYNGLTAELGATNQDMQFVPDRIDDLSAEAETAAVVLSWTVPYDGGAGIEKYQYRQTTTSGTYTEAWEDVPSSSASTTSHTVTGLTSGLYYFLVRAVNPIGNGADSNEASATVPLALDLNGDGAATLVDARIVYYAQALSAELDCARPGAEGTRASVLVPLVPLIAAAATNDAALDVALCELLTAAKARLGNLNGAAVFYYSYALEDSLGNGTDRPGIPAIKRAILGPLAAEIGVDIDRLLRNAHALRTR